VKWGCICLFVLYSSTNQVKEREIWKQLFQTVKNYFQFSERERKAFREENGQTYLVQYFFENKRQCSGEAVRNRNKQRITVTK
jgi:hypothetical protein